MLFQTFWTSSPFSFTHTLFCLGCVLSRFGPVHTVFVYCFFSHNSPHCEISPDPLRINCRVTATVTHFSALKSSPFRCSLCVSLNTRHTHTYTLILHTSRRPLWRLPDAHKALVLINSQDTRPTWCSLTVGLILQMTQRHPCLVKGLWPTRRSQSPSPPSCPLSMGSCSGPSRRPCLPSFISRRRPEWALWLVNKFSDSGGGQLQPC